MRGWSWARRVYRVGNRGVNVASEVKEAVLAAINANLSSTDVVVVSDYANDRIIRMVIEFATGAGKASIIGPKRRDFAIYRDATLIKPNRCGLTNAIGAVLENEFRRISAAHRGGRGRGAAAVRGRLGVE